MEDWQIKHITQNLPDLLRLTRCSAELLINLQSQYVLGEDDVEEINAEKNLVASANVLYEIIRTRRGGVYDALLSALQQSNQSGAAQILIEGKRKNIDSPRTFTRKDDKPVHSSDSDISEESEHNLSLTKRSSIVDWPPPSPAEEIARVFEHSVISGYFANGEDGYSIILISTIDVNLTILKVQGMLPQSKIELKKLDIRNYIKHFFKCIKYRVFPNVTNSDSNALILSSHEEIKKENLQQLISFIKLLIRFGTYRLQKVICVLPVNVHTLEECMETSGIQIGNKITIQEDHFYLKEITSYYKQLLLHREVYDQGKPVKLKTFCKSYVYTNKEEFYTTILQGKLLVEILRYEKPPVLFRQTILISSGKTYITRKVRSQNCVQKSLFLDQTDKDVIVVSGFAEIEELKLFVGSYKGKFDIAEHQIEDIFNASCILLKDVSQLKCLEEKVNNETNLHWLNFEHQQAKLLWMKTKGDISFIQKHICEPNDQCTFNEIYLLRKNNKSLILCDCAGMGKSVLLAKLAEESRKICPKGTLIVFSVMTDFVERVKEILNKKETSENETTQLFMAILETLRAHVSLDMFTEEAFVQVVGPKTKLQLFLDGLDEIAKDKLDFAFECLKTIKEKFQTVKIYVTTRPHLLNRLERCLNTLGYNIEPFTRDDQIKYLTEYWSNYQLVERLPVNLEGLKEFTINCLDLVNKTLSKDEKDIAGVPLQCLLIGEVFEKEGKQWADPNSVKPPIEIKVKSLPDLFQKMVEKKFNSFEARYLKEKECKLYSRSLELFHIYLSVCAIYPGTEWPKKLQSKLLKKKVFNELKCMFSDWNQRFSDFTDNVISKINIQSVGLVQMLGDESADLQFVHRTFAEYFLAKYATESIIKTNKISDKIHQFISEAIFETYEETVIIHKQDFISFRFKFPVICQLVNIMLNSKNFEKFQTQDQALKCTTWKKILFASLHENCLNILSLYLVHMNRTSDVQRDLLILATHLSTSEAIQAIGYKSELFKNCPTKLLEIAMERGDKPTLVHLFATCGMSKELNDQNPQELQNIFSKCMMNTVNSSQSIIKDKKYILEEVLTQHLKKLMTTKTCALLMFSENIHIDLLVFIVSQVKHEFANSTDKHGKTVLHKAAEYLSAEDYTNFIDELQKHHPSLVSELSFYRDDFGQTPLHTVVRYMEPSIYILTCLSNIRENIFDDAGYTPAWNSIRYHRSLECITFLLNLQANHNCGKVDKFGRTALHIAAQHSVDESIFEMLVQTGLNFNQTDSFGNTPVFYTLHNPDTNTVIRIMYKCENKLKLLNSRNEERLLLSATELGKLDTIKLLNRHGIEFTLGN